MTDPTHPSDLERAREKLARKLLADAHRGGVSDEITCPDCGLMSCVCYDDTDAIWCDRCHGTGSVDCYCCGDFCCCSRGGEYDCPRCGGQGEFVPAPGQLEREAESHRKLREIMAAALNPPAEPSS